MEVTSLVLLAYSLAQPFLEKTQEGIARKIGEDIWTLMKKPFEKKGIKQVDQYAQEQKEDFKKELESELNKNEAFKVELQDLIEKAQKSLSEISQQNLNNYGEVEKQINIQNNSGNISM